MRGLVLLVLAAILFAGGASAQQTITGSAGGALYEFLVPQPWNGHLIVYAHGYVDSANPLALPSSPEEQQIFQAVTSQGFALAVTSYSQNGWAVQEGAQNTNELRDLFAARVGKPARTYLVGVSMGGLITVDLAENLPTKYDGALSICGIVGGSRVQWQRVGDGRVLFDYFFPGVLPGDLLHTPNLDYSPGSPTWLALVNSLVAGLASPGLPTLQFANVAGLTGSTPGEIIFSALSLFGNGFNELLQRTQGHNFYDNSATIYMGSANDAALNAQVQRFRAEPDAVNYVNRYYSPTGELRIPMLTLHTTQDPLAPFSQESSYASVVAGAGGSNLLVQQSVNRYGHCNLKPQEILNSFQGLLGWVNYGLKPAGGDVTVP
ncbi:MAG: hypothetical protein HYR60_05095 [Acidobacteria bacterium]|nr:hypothetical protein [Acidobacteriota bacterium]